MDVKLDRVTYTFPNQRRAVREVSLEVPSGQLVVILGGGWSGRTVLLRLIAGDLQPTSGSVCIGGLPPAERRGDIGWLGKPTAAARRRSGTFSHGGVETDVAHFAVYVHEPGWRYDGPKALVLGALLDGVPHSKRFAQLARECGTTAVLISYPGSGLANYADRVVVLFDGRVLNDMDGEQWRSLVRSPRGEMRTAFTPRGSAGRRFWGF